MTSRKISGKRNQELIEPEEEILPIRNPKKSSGKSEDKENDNHNSKKTEKNSSPKKQKTTNSQPTVPLVVKKF